MTDFHNRRRDLGATLRNETGELMGAYAQPIVGSFSLLVTELMALKAGMCFVTCQSFL